MAMAKVIVLKTLQYPGEKESVVVLPSDKPQAIPDEIAEEAVERGLAKLPEEEPEAETSDGKAGAD